MIKIIKLKKTGDFDKLKKLISDKYHELTGTRYDPSIISVVMVEDSNDFKQQLNLYETKYSINFKFFDDFDADSYFGYILIGEDPEAIDNRHLLIVVKKTFFYIK